MPEIRLPDEFITETRKPIHYESEHSMVLKSGRISFRTVTEDCFIYGEDGAPEATVTSISYLRTDVQGPRPVMFFWNGGPGSATNTLHLQCFGPWLIDSDDKGVFSYGLHEDADCLLDVCDLVFVDPVNVGYSRIFDKSKVMKYASVDGDARSVAFFMLDWLLKHHRWDSPVYICGESYGTIRACRVLAELGRSPYSESRKLPGLPVRGVVLVGVACGTDVLEPGLDLGAAMLPGMAATNWYHHPQGKGEQLEFVQAAWEFAKHELIPALFDGDDCTDARLRAAAEKYAHFTGMPAEYFIKNRLVLQSADDFMTAVVAAEGSRVDVYDSRVTSPLDMPYNLVGDTNVPLLVMNGLLAERLGVGRERLYYTGNLTLNPYWQNEGEPLPPHGKPKTHMECLRGAMLANKDMRLLVANGLYDLCTHAGNSWYIFSHAGLPRERVTQKNYFGGHGVYSTPEGKAQFLSDIRELIKG